MSTAFGAEMLRWGKGRWGGVSFRVAIHPAWVIIVTEFRAAGGVGPYGGIVAVYHPPGLGGYRYPVGGRFVNRPYGVIMAVSVFS